MNPLALITEALRAFTAWCNSAAIRERRELRAESLRLRHEILDAADSDNTRLLGELQDAYADNRRDCAALLPPSSATSDKRD